MAVKTKKSNLIPVKITVQGKKGAFTRTYWMTASQHKDYLKKQKEKDKQSKKKVAEKPKAETVKKPEVKKTGNKLPKADAPKRPSVKVVDDKKKTADKPKKQGVKRVKIKKKVVKQEVKPETKKKIQIATPELKKKIKEKEKVAKEKKADTDKKFKEKVAKIKENQKKVRGKIEKLKLKLKPKEEVKHEQRKPESKKPEVKKPVVLKPSDVFKDSEKPVKVETVQTGFDNISYKDYERDTAKALRERKIKPVTDYSAKEVAALKNNKDGFNNFFKDNEALFKNIAHRTHVNQNDFEDAMQVAKENVFKALNKETIDITADKKVFGKAFLSWVYTVASNSIKNFQMEMARQKGSVIGRGKKLGDEGTAQKEYVFTQMKPDEISDDDFLELMNVKAVDGNDFEAKVELESVLAGVRNKIAKDVREAKTQLEAGKRQLKVFDIVMKVVKGELTAKDFKQGEKVGFDWIGRQVGISGKGVEKIIKEKIAPIIKQHIEKSKKIGLFAYTLLKSAFKFDMQEPNPELMKMILKSDGDAVYYNPVLENGVWRYYLVMEKSRAVPVGTVRMWGNRKVKKEADGKWIDVITGKEAKNKDGGKVDKKISANVKTKERKDKRKEIVKQKEEKNRQKEEKKDKKESGKQETKETQQRKFPSAMLPKIKKFIGGLMEGLHDILRSPDATFLAKQAGNVEQAAESAADKTRGAETETKKRETTKKEDEKDKKDNADNGKTDKK